MEGIAEHVASARAAGELPDEAAVRTLLDRLGEPEEIVAAAIDELPGVGSVWTGLEIAAVIVLGFGSFVVPVVGTVVGLFLVWRSPRWTSRQKGVATALALASVAVVVSAVAGGPVTLPIALFAGVFLAVFGHVIAAVYLTLVLNRRPVG